MQDHLKLLEKDRVKFPHNTDFWKRCSRKFINNDDDQVKYKAIQAKYPYAYTGFVWKFYWSATESQPKRQSKNVFRHYS